MAGKLYGVSVGPGDPELMTIKAKRCIESSDIIAYPVKVYGEKSTALDIVKGAMDVSGKRVEEILFEMNPDPSVREGNYKDAIKKMASLLEEGNVAMINLGDATVFSTYMHVSLDVSEMGYDTETIPGVTSFCSGASEAGMPLMIDNEGLAIVPMAKENDQVFNALRDFDNIVVMKAFNSMKKLASMMGELRIPLENAVVVSNVGMDDQHIGELDPEKKYGYFTTVIIKKKGGKIK